MELIPAALTAFRSARERAAKDAVRAAAQNAAEDAANEAAERWAAGIAEDWPACGGEPDDGPRCAPGGERVLAPVIR